jgi:predicted DsbA family dithiol-disulfide isomerase
MADRQTLTIDVVSDVVCPWCYLGQKRLDKAISAVSDVDVSVNWRPFQLDPTIPPEGMDRKAYMKAKFGDEARLRDAHARLEALGKAEGIDYAFDAITVSPNTLDAHRVIRWAGAEGAETQNRLVRDLFKTYFERGENIGDRAVLVDVARGAGMEGAVVESLLAGDADSEAVANEAATASRMGVTGVPCFLFEGKYAVMGAQDVSTLTDAIRQIAAAKARGELDA